MIRHSFKLIWNQKKKNAFTILELFLLFVVIFVGSSILLEKIIIYSEGVGAKTDNVYYLFLIGEEAVDGQHMEPMLQLQNKFKDLDWTEEVSITQDASPYIWSYSGSHMTYNEKNTHVGIKQVDHNYDDVLGIELMEGKWFDAVDTSTNPMPVVIDMHAAKKLFGDTSAVGKIAEFSNMDVKIVGVVSHFKRNNYEIARPTIFVPITRFGWEEFSRTEFLFKIKDNAQPNPKELKQLIFSVLDPTYYKIRKAAYLNSMKKSGNSYESSQLLMIILIAAFLIFNFLLGLIGILGYNINKRKSEIGIRRAIGSTRSKIRKLLLLEINIITLLAMIPALVIVLQIPLFDIMTIPSDLFLKSLGVTIFVIFTLISLTVYYPSTLASRIEPAKALNEE